MTEIPDLQKKVWGTIFSIKRSFNVISFVTDSNEAFSFEGIVKHSRQSKTLWRPLLIL